MGKLFDEKIYSVEILFEKGEGPEGFLLIH